MKLTRFLTFLILFTFVGFLPYSFSQPPLLPLPEGALMRLGNGWSTQIDVSPDGTRLAVGSCKGIWLYDVNTAKELQLLTGHSDAVLCVKYSPDGKMLASGSFDNNLCLWDAATGELLHTLMGNNGYINSIAFSPNGKTLASGNEQGIVQLWNTTTGKHFSLLAGQLDKINSVAFSPDGKTSPVAVMMVVYDYGRKIQMVITPAITSLQMYQSIVLHSVPMGRSLPVRLTT